MLLRHALPNAMVPTLNVTALNLAYLVGGVVVVEKIFSYPGFGSLLVDALQLRDLPLIEATIMIAASVYIVANLLADVGAGLGGPAAYAADRTGVRPVLVEPEPDACRAAAWLFDALVIQADATALPFADGAVGLAWSLGVLCTAPGREAQLAMLLQMRRVVRPGGRIGLLVYLAVTGELDDPPEGNHFPTSTDLHSLIRAADLDVLAVADSEDMPQPPASWQERTAAVERELERRFGHTPQLAAATGQSHRIGHLLQVGQLTSQVPLLAHA